jgi:hypothetical protein
MRAATADLPYVDEHTITIGAPRTVVWTALQRFVVADLLLADRHPLGMILGTEPRGGFAVSDSAPAERLTLVGRHRFSRYLLRFGLTVVADGATQLSARTYAAFPGVRGRVYRALVIGTGAHRVATRRILRAVRRRSIALAAAGDPAV